jgi:hypothetical protein
VRFQVPVLPAIGEGANRSARGARAPQNGITMLEFCAVARSLATRRQECLRRDDARAGWDSRTGGVANQQIIVQVPNRCLACARIIKQIVGSAVAIEIG